MSWEFDSDKLFSKEFLVFGILIFLEIICVVLIYELWLKTLMIWEFTPIQKHITVIIAMIFLFAIEGIKRKLKI